MTTISVVINTLNEQNNIRDCIQSVRGFADEIIVCDMHSDDNTVRIAKAMGATVLFFRRTGFVEPARYSAINKAKGKWVLVLDADERLNDHLATKLRSIVQQDAERIVEFRIRPWFFGGWIEHGSYFHDTHPRFFGKSIYEKYHTRDSEKIHSPLFENVPTELIVRLPRQFYADHYAYPTIDKFIVKTMAHYSSIEADQRFQGGQEFSALDILLDPPKQFVLSFLVRKGYRDGFRGFVVTCLYCFYRFIIFAKLWHKTVDQAT